MNCDCRSRDCRSLLSGPNLFHFRLTYHLPHLFTPSIQFMFGKNFPSISQDDDENVKETRKRLIQSISVISQPPTPYSNVSDQAPPSYRQLFPNIFRTFSLLSRGSRSSRRAAGSYSNSSDGGDTSVQRICISANCRCLQITLFLIFVVGLLLLIILRIFLVLGMI